MQKMKKYRQISITIRPDDLKLIDRLVQQGKFRSRSHAIDVAIDGLKEKYLIEFKIKKPF